VNIYLILVLIFLIGDYLKGFIVDQLNLAYLKEDIPEDFREYYDNDTYRKSQQYLKDKTRFSLFQGMIMLVLTIALILMGGFNSLDLFVRSLVDGDVKQGLVFFSIIIALSQVLGLPFSYYDHFVLEERYGFNKMTLRTFFSDIFKSFLVFIILGLPILSLILWFFLSFGDLAWLYCCGALVVIQIVLMFLAPTLIMPLFNKFEPLEDGELKSAIEAYAQKERFPLGGLFTMDGSKRSSKANAFFTGFGSFRRIVLFDTLIKNHSVNELLGILAHEMGHFKKKHILKMIVSSIIQTVLMFYVLSLFLNNKGLFDAFGMEHISIYASLLFFGFLYSPISQVLSILGTVMSRKHEFEADEYAVMTTGLKDEFIMALKKLSVDNLSNLTPHPLKVFLEYSHPPVLERIKAIQKLKV